MTTDQPPRVVFFGTPAAAVEVLAAVLAARYPVAAVVTQPDRPSGRGGVPTPPPVKVFARQRGIPVLQPARSADIAPSLQKLSAVVGILFSYGKLLPPAVLQVLPFGILNVHPSLLPRYRGPTPVAQAIIDGSERTGATVIKLDEQLDHGPIVAQVSTRVADDERAPELLQRLVAIGTGTLLAALPAYLNGTFSPLPQDHAHATYTKIISRDDGRIRWSFPAASLHRRWRAYQPWPGIFTSWTNRRLRVVDCYPHGGNVPMLLRGQVARFNGVVLVGCGEGRLQLRAIQLEGGKILAVEEFLRGHPTFVGAQLD